MDTPKPLGKKRSKSQRERDKRLISSLYMQGRTQAEIEEKVGVDQTTVSRTLATLQNEWQRSSLMDFNAAKARELAKIDNLEREYWEAWERSKLAGETSTTKRVEGDKQRTEAQIRKEDQIGDPRYLKGVEWCIDRRAKLLGIDSPIEANIHLFDIKKWMEDRKRRIESVTLIDADE